MANTVKTAISMQKELFEQVNQLAEELRISRSKLFVIAVQDFINAYKEEVCSITPPGNPAIGV